MTKNLIIAFLVSVLAGAFAGAGGAVLVLRYGDPVQIRRAQPIDMRDALYLPLRDYPEPPDEWAPPRGRGA